MTSVLCSFGFGARYGGGFARSSSATMSRLELKMLRQLSQIRAFDAR